MRLESVRFTDFRCFDHLEIDLDPKLTVLVGNNGSGKSAILDGIAVGLGRILTHLPEVQGITFKDTDLRQYEAPEGAKAPYVRVELQATIRDLVWDVTKKRDKSAETADKVPRAIGMVYLGGFLNAVIDRVAESKPVHVPVIAYYGTNRAVIGIPVRQRGFRKQFTRFGALSEALQATSRFKTVFEWFYLMEREELAQQRDLRDFDFRLPSLQAVRKAITSAVRGSRNPRITTRPIHFVVTIDLEDGSEETLYLEQLSDGYRTMMALVMDLARRMAQANPHLQDPLESEAIVLIDEVDLHLHPQWQQTVLPDLLRTFPNTQFIVTTHSPQVLSTIEPQHIREIYFENGCRRLRQPRSSYGAESGRLLRDILRVDPRPPDNEMTRALNKYFSLIDKGQWDTEEGTALREKLENWSQGEEPDLVRADMEIQRKKLFET